jgi:hypothetical protein
MAKLWTLFTNSTHDSSASDVPPFRPESLPKWPLIVVDESAPLTDGAAKVNWATRKNSGVRY